MVFVTEYPEYAKTEIPSEILQRIAKRMIDNCQFNDTNSYKNYVFAVNQFFYWLLSSYEYNFICKSSAEKYNKTLEQISSILYCLHDSDNEQIQLLLLIDINFQFESNIPLLLKYPINLECDNRVDKKEITFEMLEKFFCRFKIFPDGEMYWYECMWKILAEKGLTSYSDDYECCEVVLRAIALLCMFSDYSAMNFDEKSEMSVLYDSDFADQKSTSIYDEAEYNIKISLLPLYVKLHREPIIQEENIDGQMQIDMFQMLIDDETNMLNNYEMIQLANTYRSEVVKAISKRISTQQFYLSFYATSTQFYETEELSEKEKYDCYGRDCDPDDYLSHIFPHNAEEFWNTFLKHSSQVNPSGCFWQSRSVTRQWVYGCCYPYEGSLDEMM